jgi:hypothetical protein
VLKDREADKQAIISKALPSEIKVSQDLSAGRCAGGQGLARQCSWMAFWAESGTSGPAAGTCMSLQAHDALLQSCGTLQTREQVQAFLEAVKVGGGCCSLSGCSTSALVMRAYATALAACPGCPVRYAACRPSQLLPTSYPMCALQPFELSKAELVQLVNLKPNSPVEIYLVGVWAGQQRDPKALATPAASHCTKCTACTAHSAEREALLCLHLGPTPQ